ncbi:MAG TPA: CBS domain-containing protein [Solirubrobacteraceae bacterium]|nr:CBS domain-containing protein [Solirubrobacteraceae bacterium]
MSAPSASKDTQAAQSAERQTPPILHLSSVMGSPLRDSDGERLGRVQDLIVRLGGVGYPPITGVLVRVAGRTSYLGVERVSDIGADGVVLRKAKLDLRRFERRPEEVLLGRDLLDRQLINVEGARLVRANEIELALVAGSWRVVGVDTGPRGGLRRLLPKQLGSHIAVGEFLDWAEVEPFVGHVPTVRLRVPHPKLARLHPAQIADLVEAASRREGEEIIQAVGDGDRELEADVFEELDDHHQREFLEDRPDAQIAAILARMAPDDAADIVGELDDERREPVLALLPVSHRVKVRALLGYDPAEAGGLMSPDFVLLAGTTSAGEAIAAVQRSEIAAELLGAVFVSEPDGTLTGAIAVTALLRMDSARRLADAVRHELPCLSPDTSFEELARLMADYNLTSIPVVDEGRRMLGVVTVDDVLEAMLPRGWRRRFGLLGED